MIYILAQGAGSRWKDGLRFPGQYDLPSESKLMIPVAGEPNLLRTVRMLTELGASEYMVIAEGTIFTPAQVDTLPNKIKTLHYPGNILHGVYQLLEQGQAYTFLLGDVIYSRQTLANILVTDEYAYTLWGRSGENQFTGKAAPEIFALTVNKEFVPLVRVHLEMIQEYESKLWGYYHHFLFNGNWEEVTDWTDDIDSPEEYVKFFEKLKWQAVNETS